MAISGKSRKMMIGGALILTLAAVGWVNKTEQISDAQANPSRQEQSRLQPDSQPQPVKTGEEHPKDAIAEIQLDKLKRAPLDAEQEDLFKRKSWYVPPPPPKPVPPPPPMAPPLPFSYVGKLIDGGKVTVFMSRQDRNYAVKEGESIDGTYRVEEVKPPLMTLVYLPLNQKQTMQIGEAN